MMTLSDVRRHASNATTSNGDYSEQKDAAAWELFNLDRIDRATRIERFIAEQIEKRSGYDCTITRPNWEWDITVNLEDKPVKVEVKSSIQKKGFAGAYQIANVKPWLFDYLFVVLVTPEGTKVAWAKSSDVSKFCTTKTENCNGYMLNLNIKKFERGAYPWLRDISDFPY